jgi:hypothetical protein
MALISQKLDARYYDFDMLTERFTELFGANNFKIKVCVQSLRVAASHTDISPGPYHQGRRGRDRRKALSITGAKRSWRGEFNPDLAGFLVVQCL